MMDRGTDKPNPFSSLEKTSKLPDIFGGTTQHSVTKPTDAERESTAHNIFGKLGEIPPSTVPGTSVPLGSSILSQEKAVIQSDPFKKDGKDSPISVGTGNIFESELSSTSSSSSSSPHDSNIFGGKMDTGRSDSQDSSPFAVASSNVVPSASTISDSESIFRRNDSNSGLFSLIPSSKRTSVLSSQFGAPAPVFSSSSQSKQIKDSKTSLFGGKTIQSPIAFTSSGNTFGFAQEKSDSSKKSPVFAKSYTLRKATLANIQKPSLIFSLKSEKNETPQTSFPTFTSMSKFRSEPIHTLPAPPPRVSSQEKKVSAQSASKESSNIFYLASQPSQQDDNAEENYDIFSDDSKCPPAEVKISPAESTVLIAVDIPPDYFDFSILKNHFSKYGAVKVFLSRKTNQASIQFETHKAAAEAKAKGKKLHPNIPEMKLFFGANLSDKKVVKPPKKTPQSEKPILVKPKIVIRPSSSEKAVQKPKPLVTPKKSEFKNKAPSGNLGSVKDLSVLMKSQAKNNYDKYLILDARDKILRAKQKKVVDVKKAQYLLATCPDMCPEKERYSRDIQYDFGIYETTDGEIDHKLAVKKFSRSSADKDEPLPHELRPGPVLRMTIDFLICNVMNKADEDNVQIDLWFNYLFNRTRALRNDIMQQHLLDHHAVYVLERCTRFHIHCSHHLCEEPPDYFDPKINTEHLTKSLQSLKELYHDMGEKNVYFDTEPEFRAYEILLCVNDGNVIFKYLKFRDAVRNSTEVQFAVRVLHSLHTNNYIQFFKLLRRATYLQACIMHKYFAEFRLKALNVIVKAYKSQQLPVTNFMTKLGFSNEDEFKKFIDYFGISVNEDSKVVYSKTTFVYKSESPPPLTRSHDITAEKMPPSTGQIVQNGPLPENPLGYYHPHDSFDSMGFLEHKAHNASDQSSTSYHKASQETEDNAGDDSENESLQKELYAKVEEMSKMNLLRRRYNAWVSFARLQKHKRKMKEKLELFILRKFTKIWRQKVAKSVEANKKVDEHLQRKYFQKWKAITHSSLEKKEYIQKAKLVEKKIVLRKFVKIWQSNAAYRKSLKKAKSAREYLLAYKYVMKWRSYKDVMRLERKSKNYYDSKLLRISFTHWRNWCISKRKRSKYDFQSFPPIGSQVSSGDLNKLLDWGYDRPDRLNLSAYEISQLDNDISVKSRKHFSLQQLSGIVAWTALPLLQRFQADVNSQPPDFSGNLFSKCFKVLILTCSGTNDYLLEWVRTKFNILEVEDLSVPLHSHSQFISRRNELTYTVIVSEKELEFSSKIDPNGASLVILVGNEDKLARMNSSSIHLTEHPYLILCKSQSEENFSENIWLMTKETVDNPFTSEKLFNVVFQLWQRRNTTRILQMGKCSLLADKFISEKVMGPVYRTVNQRKFYDKPTVNPSQMVDFFNAAISHIQSCIEKVKDTVQEWLPSEASSHPFGSYKPCNHTPALSSAFQKVYLPPFILETDSSSISVRDQLAKYLKDVASEDDWNGDLFSEVERIIKQTERKIYNVDFHSSFGATTKAGDNELYQLIPWVEILSCCIFFKLSLLPAVDIAYVQSDIDSFDENERWVSLLRVSELENVLASNDDDLKIKRKIPIVEMDTEPKKRKTLPSQFLQEIEEEKQKSLQLERELKSHMLVEEELKLLFPDYDLALANFNQ